MSVYLVGTSPKKFLNYGMHDHDCAELILNLEGMGTEKIKDQEYSFRPGSISIIAPKTKHNKCSEEGFRDIYMHFDLEDLEKETGNALRREKKPLFLLDDGDETLKKLLTVMLTRYLMNGKSDLLLEKIYRSILTLLKEWVQMEQVGAEVAEVLHQLSASYNDPEFRVTDALLASGYQKDYIRRKFCAAMHMTPNEYLTEIRMNYALELLRQQESLHFSISDISLMCGYYDARYFSRIFKRRTGKSPSEYVKMYK